MFATRKKRPLIEVTKLSSLVAEDVVITGDVCFASGIRIDGCIKGNVTVRPSEGQGHALLVLSQKGQIHGSVRCGDAVVNGTVVGDLEVDHFLELQSECRVSGTIRYHHLQMEVGAVVRGQLLDEPTSPMASNVVELALDKTTASA
jgi:cytoskeletal protein CcmA (bactofilin family)